MADQTYNFMNEQVTANSAGQVQTTAPIQTATSNSSGSLSNVVTGASTPYNASTYTPPPPSVITPQQTTGAPNLTIPAPSNDLSAANSMVAGGVQTTNNLQSYLTQLTPPAGSTPVADQNQGLIDSLSSLYGQDIGKAQAEATGEQNAGIPQMQKDLQGISNDILTKNAEYQKISTNINGEAIPMDLIRGQQADASRQQASDIGLLTARSQALQGNITLATQTVQKAVALQFAGIEEKIAAQEKQLALIQPLLSAEQAKIAKAQDAMLATQKEQVAQQKANSLEVQKLGIQAASGNAPQELINQAMATNDPVKAAEVLAAYLKGPTESTATASGTTQGTLFKVPTAKELGGAQFYKYPSGSQVYSSAGKLIDLATYKQLTNQTNVPDAQVNFSGIKTVSPTSTTSTGTIKTTVAQDVTSMNSQLQTVKGTDGYLSPQDWKTALNAWVNAGHSATSFTTNFKQYINPADPQDYK
jgi:hypothetical protein